MTTATVIALIALVGFAASIVRERTLRSQRDRAAADTERLREALDWIYTEPEDALRVQTWARAALDGKPFEGR